MSHSHDHHAMHGMMANDQQTTMHHHGTSNMVMGTDDTMGDMGGMGNHTCHMMMMMYFHVGYDETVLFEQWKVDSVGKMVGSCIGIFLMAILYEGLKYFRERLHRDSIISIDYSNVQVPNGKGQINHVKKTVSCQKSMLSLPHSIQTCLHLVQLVLSYFLMLIVMTYNVWLCLAVVLGCAVGYFLFGWQKSFVVDITEHCH